MGEDIVEQLNHIFKPRAMAVIGASKDPLKWGNWMVQRPLDSGFRGTIYPVNPGEKEVLGLECYPSIQKVPGDVELAVIVVPASVVPQVMEDCVQKGVRGAVVISAGFAEVGPEGAALQRKIIEVANRGGIRFIGPNCMGVWSASVRLNLSFRGTPKSGPVAFISQSGTLGGYLFEAANAKGYGFSKYISTGNEANLENVDYLRYFADDPETKVVVLYIEGVRNGKEFVEVARETVKKKPVVVYKAGRTNVGARATLSHTGSLAGMDAIFEAACKQAGVIRMYEAFHPFDLAEALVNQPLPRGARVVVIGSGGGYCVTCSDACESMGLEVPEFDAETQVKLKAELLPHAATPRNPIDTAADQRPLTYARLTEMVAQLPYIDGIIVMPPLGGYDIPDYVRSALSAAETIASIPKKYGKPIIATGMRSRLVGPAVAVLRNAGIPFYETPEDCARAMHGLAKYAQNLDKLKTS